jgi:hypothetical protein
MSFFIQKYIDLTDKYSENLWNTDTQERAEEKQRQIIHNKENI